jgi:hypothetical protein
VWPFRADAEREALISASAGQIAALAGHHLVVRRTTVPFPAADWALQLAASSRPLPDALPPALDGWADDVIRNQAGTAGQALERVVPTRMPTTWRQHLSAAYDRIEQQHYHDTRTYFGVEFTRPTRVGRKVDTDTVLAALAEQIVQITEVVSGPGLAARPAGHDDMLWLLYRSVGIGLTPTDALAGDVGPDDISEFADAIAVERDRFSSTTKLTDRRTGETVHVAVLTVGRMEPLRIPQIHEPWANVSAQMDFPTEWSSRVLVLDPATARKTIAPQTLKIRSQQLDYADHNLDAPRHLARLAERALDIEDALDTGRPENGTRVHGYHRIAVWAPTATECLARARELTRAHESALKMQLVHTRAQYHLLREFIPGEPTINVGHLRRLPAMMFAAAVPQAAAVVGDNRGDYIGQTDGGAAAPVMLDLHFPMEVRERSGLAVLVSEPGGGKSTLMGALGYLNARRGVQVTLMDPSGPLARLADMPELAPFTRVINLVGSQRGTLAPYAMIPTPNRLQFPAGPEGDDAFEGELEMARAERMMLVLDILTMLLPPTSLEDKATVVALREAVRNVPAEETSTLDQVVEELHAIARRRDDPYAAAAVAGDMLGDMARLPKARMFFGTPPVGILTTDAALTVITMQGLQLPDPASDRRYWTLAEQLAVPMVHLANQLAVRRCYGGPMTSRKLVGLDEAHFLAAWDSGRAFLVRVARDSRKWNLAALVASQNPRDILSLDVQNLVSTVLAGRIAKDPQIAAEALRMLQIPARAGYEATLAELSQVADLDSHRRLGYREFLVRDVDGRVQKIRIDVDWITGLLDTLDTTPGPATAGH